MRHIDDNVVKFWLKGPAYYYASSTKIVTEGTPWQLMSLAQRANLRKAVAQSISVGGTQSVPGHIYNHLCMCVKPKWWAMYDNGKNAAIHLSDDSYQHALEELAVVFNAFGSLQTTAAAAAPATRNSWEFNPPSVTTARAAQRVLYVSLEGRLGRREFKREVYKLLDIDTAAQTRMVDLIEQEPTFRVTYGNSNAPIHELVPKGSE